MSDEVMTTLVKIKLNTIDDVKKFCTICGALGCETALRGGTYRVNAASILGVISLNLSEAVTLEIQDGTYIKYFTEWLCDE